MGDNSLCKGFVTCFVNERCDSAKVDIDEVTSHNCMEFISFSYLILSFISYVPVEEFFFFI
jgi:hypothetical protein